MLWFGAPNLSQSQEPHHMRPRYFCPAAKVSQNAFDLALAHAIRGGFIRILLSKS